MLVISWRRDRRRDVVFVVVTRISRPEPVSGREFFYLDVLIFIDDITRIV